jgi:hypothetical protein
MLHRSFAFSLRQDCPSTKAGMTDDPNRGPSCSAPLAQVGNFWGCPQHGQVSVEKPPRGDVQGFSSPQRRPATGVALMLNPSSVRSGWRESVSLGHLRYRNLLINKHFQWQSVEDEPRSPWRIYLFADLPEYFSRLCNAPNERYNSCDSFLKR